MSSHLQEIDQQYVLHTYARNYVHFVRGHNATLFDSSDLDYIDFAAGVAVANVGHGNARLAEAIYAQAKKLIHTSNLYLIEPQARLAERIVKLSGYDMRCFFSNSGAEANEGAIKIARRYGEVDGQPKRYKVITLENSFHGRTISTLRATGQEKMHHYFGPFPDGFAHAQNLQEVYALIDDHTVAVLVELVKGEGGIEPLDKAEVQALQKHLRERNILLMIDEVQTGIYRTGELLASQLYEIEPDVIALAKGLGGGVPIGCIMTRLKEIFQPGDHGSTFGGNYLVTAAALEVLDILEEYKNSGEMDRMVIYFESKLDRLYRAYPEVFEEKAGFGFMRGLRCKTPELQGEILKKAFGERVLLLKASRNFLRLMPPITISQAEIDAGFERLHAVMAAM